MTDLKPDFTKISLDAWDLPIFRETGLRTDILRLDKIHPEISGNKWFKLKYYLEKANADHKNILISFGGAYSNHLLALAVMAHASGFRSIGLIRGEQPAHLSHTLTAVKQYGMQLIFLPRTVYDLKKRYGLLEGVEKFTHLHPETVSRSIIIPEGGAGFEGLRGCEEILSLIPQPEYTHVCMAVGTGTTMAGMINASQMHLKIIGISVLKGTCDLEPLEVSWIKDPARLANVQMVHDYHFGGYAKYNGALIGFMNKTYAESGIPTDFVYTGKLLFAVISMAEMKLFPPGSRILVIHTGGLQGNRSLTPGLLGF